MNIFHISAECYPAAKTGGLGDVVGALPKYQIKSDHQSTVIIPHYHLPWFFENPSEIIFSGSFYQGFTLFQFDVRSFGDVLGFPLLTIDIPGLFDRRGVYADENGFFGDSLQRWSGLSVACCEYLMSLETEIDMIHCHDHHTALIPFFTLYVPEFEPLSSVPTLFTIHNGKYQGRFTWYHSPILPYFRPESGGILEWDQQINLLATGVKCAWGVTTVSPSYMEELRHDSDGLEWLFNNERNKSYGILNGIDNDTWDPASDPYLHFNLKKSRKNFKSRNKKWICELAQFDASRPLVTFIGRLVHEKGVDFLSYTIDQILKENNTGLQFFILGSGHQEIELLLRGLQNKYPDRVKLAIKYDEKLAHQLYAGSDFLLMPSRVEPCGLNQFYAMRYGTVPIVNKTGGLQDSVFDISESEGTGILIPELQVGLGVHALYRAQQLFNQKDQFQAVQDRCFDQDYSWERSSEQYISLYNKLKISANE